MISIYRGIRIGCGVVVLGLCIGTAPSTAQLLSESDKSALQDYLREAPASDASTRAPAQAPEAPVSTPDPLSETTNAQSRRPQANTNTPAPENAPVALTLDDALVSEQMANHMADSEMRLRERLNGNAERHEQLQQSLSAMQMRHQVLRQRASSIPRETLP